MDLKKRKDFDRNGLAVRRWAIASAQVLKEAETSSVHMVFTSDKNKRSLVVTAAFVDPEHRDGLIDALNEAAMEFYKSKLIEISVHLDRFEREL